MSMSSIIHNAVTGTSAAAQSVATSAASAAGSLANSASSFEAMLLQMESGNGSAASSGAASATGTQAASNDPFSALGTLTMAGAAGVEQMLGNAIQQALQSYGSSSASSALPPLSI